MKSQVTFTRSQIATLLTYAKVRDGEKGRAWEDLQFLYNPNTPDKIYVKYTRVKLGADNSIESDLEVKCVDTDGSSTDCYDQFNTLAEQMAFASDFIEIDIDKGGKLVML